MNKWIIAIIQLQEASSFYGPFDTPSDARRYAQREGFSEARYHVVPLYPPMKEREK